MFKDNFITICRAHNAALTGKSKAVHSKNTIRIYKRISSRFIEWLGGNCPDFKIVRLDYLIKKYVDSLNVTGSRRKQVFVALNYQSRKMRTEMVKKEIFTIRPDSARFSKLVKLSGKKGVPKAPSPI
jgi:hypothetical protein